MVAFDLLGCDAERMIASRSSLFIESSGARLYSAQQRGEPLFGRGRCQALRVASPVQRGDGCGYVVLGVTVLVRDLRRYGSRRNLPSSPITSGNVRDVRQRNAGRRQGRAQRGRKVPIADVHHA
jgi:hypothetical protein